MKFTKLFIALFLIAACAMTAFSPESGGYLKNKTNSATTDTIATATANDTSYTFVNTGYSKLYAQFYQNSTYQQFEINSPAPSAEIRYRYAAADSTLRIEEKGLLGWFPVFITTTSSATAQSYEIPLRTGNAVVSINGKD